MNQQDLQKVAQKLPLSNEVIALNAGSSGLLHLTENVATPPASAPSKRIRQSSKPLMNKLETDFYQSQLERSYPVVWKQAIRFRLGNGIWYKPDFVANYGDLIICWEVKGPHAFRGGFENLKVAASQYPTIRWMLVWKDSGVWTGQQVLP